MFRLKLTEKLTLTVALILSIATQASAEIDIISCNSDTSCSVKIYRSDVPTLLAVHQIVASGTTPIDASNQISISYDGLTATITCNDSWQDLNSGAGPITYQNRIRCRVSNDRNTIGVDLEVYDQSTFDNITGEQPSEVGYPELANTSQSLPFCEHETSPDTASACKWETREGQGWAVFARSTVTDFTLGFGIPTGQPATPITNWCGEDLNGNGSYDEGEAGVCVESDQGLLCLYNSVECTTASPTPICPTGGTLNPVTDRCEHQPTYPCPPSMVWDPRLGICVAWSNCTNLCPAGYTYNSNRNICTRPPCGAGATFNPTTRRCEMLATYRCPLTGQTGNDLGICNSNCTQPGVCQNRGFEYQWWWLRATNTNLPGTIEELCLTAAEANQIFNTFPRNLCFNDSIYCAGEFPGWTEVYRDRPTSGTYRHILRRSNGWICSSTGAIFNSGTQCQANCIVTQGCLAQCPSGYTNVGGLCIINPTCPNGGTLSVQNERCEIPPNFSTSGCSQTTTPECQGGYSFMVATGLCETNPICESGSYNPITDLCPTGFLCPYGPNYPCRTYQGETRCSPYECNEVQDGEIIENDTATGINDKQDDGQTNESGECLGQIYIFNGKDNRCRSDGLTIQWGNCCKDDDYLFGMNQCEEAEIALAERKQRGLCHEIGEYCSKEIDVGFSEICIEHKKTYCCFNSKLGRIIQEQGREQLSTIDWGSPQSPECRGYTPEEFQMLDWSQIDLQEYFGDIQTPAQQEVSGQMQTTVQGQTRGTYQQ